MEVVDRAIEQILSAMRKIEFHDRNRELKEIRNILEREPSLITFIYGPINSGKTELISNVVKQLPAEDYAIFRINLVKRNVLFVDPTRRTIRPQSRLDLLAIREMVKEAYKKYLLHPNL
ncbi:MAG: hypothetical protein J7K81_09585 [Methanophagales archaeon]|nr:hypothetical protein [Methanophagales archaeon]